MKGLFCCIILCPNDTNLVWRVMWPCIYAGAHKLLVYGMSYYALFPAHTNNLYTQEPDTAVISRDRLCELEMSLFTGLVHCNQLQPPARITYCIAIVMSEPVLL